MNEYEERCLSCQKEKPVTEVFDNGGVYLCQDCYNDWLENEFNHCEHDTEPFVDQSGIEKVICKKCHGAFSPEKISS